MTGNVKDRGMMGMRLSMKLKYKRLLMIILCIALVIPQIMISNRVVVQGSSSGVCTANTLNIRTGPGTEYDKVTVDGMEAFLTKNQVVTVISEENGWFHIQTSFNEKTVEGYCLGTYIKTDSASDTVTPTATVTPTPTATATPTPTPEVQTVKTTSYKLSVPAVINASELNVREKASTSGKVLATLKNNASVTITGVTGSGSDTWYKVSTKVNKSTVKGYVLAKYVKCTFSKGFYGKIATSGVTLKKSAGANAADYLVNKKSVPIKKGTLVWLSGEETVSGVKYFRTSFTYNGTKIRGYVSASSITMLGDKVTITTTVTPTPTQVPDNPSTSTESKELNLPAVITANSLNLRKSASTSSTKLASLTKNTSVKILSVVSTGTERWYYISVSVNGKATKGYVYSSYVAFTFTKGFYGSVAAESVVMQTAPGSGKSVTLSDGSAVKLKKGTRIWLSEEQTIAGEKWFRIGLTLEGKATRGYAKASDITIIGTKIVAGSSGTGSGNTTATPTVTVKPTATPTPSPTPTEQPFTANGTIRDASALVVKAGPGYSSSFAHDASGNSLVLATGKEVKVFGKTYADNITWYQISFEYGGITYTGYVNEKYVLIDESSINQGDSTIPDSGYTDSDMDFETKLDNEGFPESYKVYLRQIHAMYPNWEFVAYHTGLDWNTVIENEASDNKNLISNIRGIGWKSLESDSYNWKTDSFIAYDGSSWVTASKEAIAYYMDPRNFLTEEGIFQFEQLTYQPSYQDLEGVENILMNTPLYQSSYTYTDDTGMEQSITYGETFMNAAEYSGVSPYHLASRVKQEVVTGASSVSNSVTGTFSGFEGLYNFYNIGAYHSTVAGGAIANGLKYAKNGSTNASLNASCLIPWNNRYRAIVGGGYYIGSSYINRGQDTIYLQKFNVTPTSTYSHQYMANVEAAYSESKKVFAAYTDVATSTIVFSIPVYLNMPETVCAAPGYVANPNNWLKKLQITDAAGNALELTPAFDLSVDQEYYLVLDSSYDMVNVLATTVSSKASVYGTGYIPLVEGQNMITVSVTAENGDIRYYNILISREN